MPQADAQSAVVTASAPNTTPGSGTVTYSASVSTTNPTLNSEQQITNVTYSWSSSDSCNPTTGSSTTVTAVRNHTGPGSSSVSCSVTWYIYNTSTKQTTTATAGGGATVNFNLGLMWTKGTITGILISPQNQTNSPYTPTAVVTSTGAQLTCTATATASDTSTFTYGSTTNTGSGSDTVSYQWTASAGTLGNATSASTTWTAPSTPQSSAVTLSCQITATAPAVVAPDGGSRGPSPTTVTVQVYMPTMTVTGGSWSPNPAYAGDIITCNASATVTPSVPGAVDNVAWQTTNCYQSADGSDPFSPYSGSSGWVYTQGSLSTSFTGFFNDPGYYLIGVSASDTLKDSSGNTLGSVSGSGYVGGGSASDISPPDGTYGQDNGNVRARTIKPNDVGQFEGVPVKPALSIVAEIGATTMNSGTVTAPISEPSGTNVYDTVAQLNGAGNQYEGETGYQATPSSLAAYKWMDNTNDQGFVETGVYDFQANIDRIYMFSGISTVLGQTVTQTCTGTKADNTTVTSNTITVRYHYPKEAWVHIATQTPYYKATSPTSCTPDASTQRLLTDTFTISFDKFPIDVQAMSNTGTVLAAVGTVVAAVPDYGPLLAAGFGVGAGTLTGISAAVSGQAVNSSPNGLSIWSSATQSSTYPEGCIFQGTVDFTQVGNSSYYGLWRWSNPTDVQQFEETDWAGNAYGQTGYTNEVQQSLYPSTGWELGGGTFWYVGD